MNLINKVCLLKNWLLGLYAKSSYSQEGEDLIIARIFEGKKIGFYIDVGAHHPLRFSNTYLLYRKGWSGINIDANPGSMGDFKIVRPRDINLEMGIADKSKRAPYYIFNEPAINTFVRTLIKHNLKVGYKLIDKKIIKLEPLSLILQKYVKNRKIDLLTIDVEGFDYKVLISMDWSYKPTVIIIEQLERNILEVTNSPSYKLLEKQGYQIYAKTVNSIIFIIK